MCVFGRSTDRNFWPRTLNFFVTLVVENYSNALFLPSNVVTIIFDKAKLNVSHEDYMQKCILDAIQHQFIYIYGRWICISIMLFSRSHIHVCIFEFAIMLN